MKAKKILAIIFSVVLTVSVLPISNAAETENFEWDHSVKTTCNGECGQSPLIVVPGLMQSQTYLQDEKGNDLKTSDGFPAVEGTDLTFMFDEKAIVTNLKDQLPDILKAILKRDRQELFDIIFGVLGDSYADHFYNPDGTRDCVSATDTYWYSLDVCRKTTDKSYKYAKGYDKDEDGNALPTEKHKTEYDFIASQVNVTEFCEKVGYDHAYYYSYGSFGNILEDAKNLNEYIDMVKCQTGHDKVDIVFVSLGGTIANAYFADYIDTSEIDRIIIAAGAIDGSYVLSDLMDSNTTFNNGYALYNDLIPSIVSIAAEDYMALAYAGNVVARAIPQEVFSDFLQEAFERAIDDVLGKNIRNCQSMWALVPSDVYPDMAQKYLSDEAHAPLKALTDKYYNIQLNAKNRIQELDKQGVDIFVITGYNLCFPPAVEHYNQSTDEIIQSTSTSIGATFAPLGESFGEDYKPAIDETYMDPDRLVDAGTCALPDKTFFIKNQSHLKLITSVNDVIGMCVAIMTEKDITDARTHTGGYRQFGEYRNISTIEKLIKQYDKADKSKVKQAKLEKCDAAYAKAKALLADRDWNQAKTKEVEEEFYKAMESAKLLDSDSSSSFTRYNVMPFLEKIFKGISDLLAKILKGNDYWLFFIPIL